jgi:hypothetical protein
MEEKEESSSEHAKKKKMKKQGSSVPGMRGCGRRQCNGEKRPSPQAILINVDQRACNFGGLTDVAAADADAEKIHTLNSFNSTFKWEPIWGRLLCIWIMP